jgi:hypothetical protein
MESLLDVLFLFELHEHDFYFLFFLFVIGSLRYWRE